VSHLYFGYGSNLRGAQMHRHCPGHGFLGIACLAGHRLAFTLPDEEWQGGVADVVADGKEEVWGALYRITEQNLAALDAYEGFDPEGPAEPNAYVRRQVEVTDGRGRTVRGVWCYFVRRPHDHVAPGAAYRAALLAGARERGLPADHLRRMARAFDGP
jgi:gamma-glutamylcyclotransferase